MIKTSAEKRVLNFKWRRRLPDAVTIASATVMIDGSDPALELGVNTEGVAIGTDGATVSCFLLGGTAGMTYRVTCQVTLTDGQIRTWTTNVVVIPYVQ